MQNLDEILETLTQVGLKVQIDKSKFLHKDVELLDFIISSGGIKPCSIFAK